VPFLCLPAAAGNQLSTERWHCEIPQLFLTLRYSLTGMAENQDNEKKPDHAEISQELFQQSADLKKKTEQTNKNLEELRRRTKALLDPDKDQ